MYRHDPYQENGRNTDDIQPVFIYPGREQQKIKEAAQDTSRGIDLFLEDEGNVVQGYVADDATKTAGYRAQGNADAGMQPENNPFLDTQHSEKTQAQWIKHQQGFGKIFKGIGKQYSHKGADQNDGTVGGIAHPAYREIPN